MSMSRRNAVTVVPRLGVGCVLFDHVTPAGVTRHAPSYFSCHMIDRFPLVASLEYCMSLLEEL